MLQKHAIKPVQQYAYTTGKLDSRMYGYKKLSDLARDRSDIFSTEERAPAGSTQKVLYVRTK